MRVSKSRVAWGALVVLVVVLIAVTYTRSSSRSRRTSAIPVGVHPAAPLGTNVASQGQAKVDATPLAASLQAASLQAPNDMSTVNLAGLLLENDRSASAFAFYAPLFKAAFAADNKVPVPNPNGPRQAGTQFVSGDLLGDLAMQLRADCRKAYTGVVMAGSPLSDADATVIGNAAAEAYGLRTVVTTKP